jgi:hypothetical protein
LKRQIVEGERQRGRRGWWGWLHIEVYGVRGGEAYGSEAGCLSQIHRLGLYCIILDEEEELLLPRELEVDRVPLLS